MSIMTSSGVPARRSAPATSPARPVPGLAVVPDGYRSPRARQRRARLWAAGVVTLSGALVFALVGVHVLLTQGQFRLATIQRQADEEQGQYVRLRLQVAQLESPDRIVAAAQERLGMTSPSALTYLTPAASSPAPASAPPAPAAHTAPRPHDTMAAWARAKPALAARP